MNHTIVTNEDGRVESYYCVVEKREELLRACVLSHARFKEFAKPPLCEIKCDDIVIKINDYIHVSQMYSHFLRLIKIQEDGVSLSKLMYN